MWPALLACADDPGKVREPPTQPPTTSVPPTTPTPPTTPPPPTTPTVPGLPDHVSLPFATVGEAVGSVRVEVAGASATVSGPFAVDAEADALVVSYTGPIDAPTIATGTAAVSVDGVVADVALAAVVGDPDLPSPAWTTDDWGTRAIAPFPSAPFPDGTAIWDDASVLVFVPAAFDDPGAVDVVTHLHGFGAVLDTTIADEHLVELHAMSGRDAVFVAPQGPVNASSGDFGKLEDPDGHARLVRDVVSVLYRDGVLERPALGTQVLTSHSGGYDAAASLLDHGGLPFAALFLYDSVYGWVDAFADYALSGGVLFSNYTAYGGTDQNNLALRQALEDAGLTVSHDFRADHLLADPAAIGFTASPHAYVMSDGLTHARWLAASPLRRSAQAPPELLAVVAAGGSAEVRWREDRAPAGLSTTVQGSDDGVTWVDLGASTTDRATVEARAWIRLVGADGRAGDAYAGAGGDWLVVDGFHRVFGGSWSSPTHDFAARLGAALGGASTAVDDAVAEGIVDLRDWDHVLWLLGDESVADATFDPDAEAALAAYLDGGGVLLVTGSELGYATGAAFLATLGVDYVADDAGATTAGEWAFGVVYPEDYPDVLASDETVWTYATGGGAAVGRADHQVLAVGFALETMADADLGPALAELAGWF